MGRFSQMASFCYGGFVCIGHWISSPPLFCFVLQFRIHPSPLRLKRDATERGNHTFNKHITPSLCHLPYYGMERGVNKKTYHNSNIPGVRSLAPKNHPIPHYPPSARKNGTDRGRSSPMGNTLGGD